MTSVKGMTVFNTDKTELKKQPMFFGALLEFKDMILQVSIFDKLTTQQLGYFWRPEEVSLQKDRSDYKTLRLNKSTSLLPI